MSLGFDAPDKVKNKTLAAVGVGALLFGIGVSQGLGKFSLGDSLRILGGSRESEPVPSAGVQVFSDFVTLAKMLRPVVVNISAIQVERQPQGFSGPFGEDDLPEGLPSRGAQRARQLQ